MRSPRWFLALLACLPSTVCLAADPPRGPDPTLPWVTAEVKAPRVRFRTFESATLGAQVSYHVYVPAAHDAPEVRLPVLYWLHGTDGGIAGIGPLSRHFDEAIVAGKIPAMLVVFVNGLPRRLWSDSKDGSAPVETVFITEVIPDVDRNFRTIATRQGRILEGFSMGGYGAARLGFRHPELFAGVSILAGGPLDLEFRGPRARHNPRLREEVLRDVCGGDLEYFQQLSPWTIVEAAAEKLRQGSPVIRHAVGDRDDTLDLNRRYHERMAALEIAHEYVELAGVGHDTPAVLDALAESSGRFYRRALGGTEGGPAAGR